MLLLFAPEGVPEGEPVTVPMRMLRGLGVLMGI